MQEGNRLERVDCFLTGADQLLAYIAGQLDEAISSRLVQHLQSCEVCVETLDELCVQEYQQYLKAECREPQLSLLLPVLFRNKHLANPAQEARLLEHWKVCWACSERWALYKRVEILRKRET